MATTATKKKPAPQASETAEAIHEACLRLSALEQSVERIDYGSPTLSWADEVTMRPVFGDQMGDRYQVNLLLTRERRARNLRDAGVCRALIEDAEAELQDAVAVERDTAATLDDLDVGEGDAAKLRRQIDALTTKLDELTARRVAAEAKLQKARSDFDSLLRAAPKPLRDATEVTKRAIRKSPEGLQAAALGATIRERRNLIRRVRAVDSWRQAAVEGSWFGYLTHNLPDAIIKTDNYSSQTEIDGEQLLAHAAELENELPELEGRLAELDAVLAERLEAAEEPLKRWAEEGVLSAAEIDQALNPRP